MGCLKWPGFPLVVLISPSSSFFDKANGGSVCRLSLWLPFAICFGHVHKRPWWTSWIHQRDPWGRYNSLFHLARLELSFAHIPWCQLRPMLHESNFQLFQIYYWVHWWIVEWRTSDGIYQFVLWRWIQHVFLRFESKSVHRQRTTSFWLPIFRQIHPKACPLDPTIWASSF